MRQIDIDRQIDRISFNGKNMVVKKNILIERGKQQGFEEFLKISVKIIL